MNKEIPPAGEMYPIDNITIVSALGGVASSSMPGYRKSKRSAAAGHCVATAIGENPEGAKYVLMANDTYPDQAPLVLPAASWTSFIDAIKRDELLG